MRPTWEERLRWERLPSTFAAKREAPRMSFSDGHHGRRRHRAIRHRRAIHHRRAIRRHRKIHGRWVPSGRHSSGQTFRRHSSEPSVHRRTPDSHGRHTGCRKSAV